MNPFAASIEYLLYASFGNTENPQEMNKNLQMKEFHNVLIISYHYAPMQAIGSNRTLSFAKYLPKYGFKPCIITPVLNKRTWFGPIDKEAKVGEEVFRVPGAHLGAIAKCIFGKRLSGFGISRSDFRSTSSNILKRFLGFFYDEILAFPDPEWPWYAMGRNRALRIARELKPDVILSRALPFSSHLIASHLQHQLHVPWVADYGDLWSKNHVRKRTKFIQRVEAYLEKRTLQRCSAVTTVSEPLAQNMREFVDIPVYAVTNGFDPEEYDALNDEPPENWKTRTINIVYTGMLYPGRRDPTVLFQAVQILRQVGVIKPGDLKLWFYGPNTEVIKDLVSTFQVETFVELQGLVPRRQALNYQKHADILLLLEWSDSAAKGVFTGKFFEYLGARKPILAIGPSGGTIEQALKETGMGILENDPNRLGRVIQNFIEKGSMKENGTAHSLDPERLKKFTREYQIGVLAEILEHAVREKAK